METTNTLRGLEKSAEAQLLKRKERQAELTAKRVADRRKSTAHLGKVDWNNAEGMKFGRLTVIKLSRRTPKSLAIMLCKCECGNEKEVASSSLRNGDSSSCGCLFTEVMKGHQWCHKHGHCTRNATTSAYVVYQGMLARCHGMGHPRYSGRGITVCDRWRFGEAGKTGFECFHEDVGDPPFKLTLDRIKNNGNYEPSNCKWSTRQEQGNNQENTIKVEFMGETLGVSEWARRHNLPRQLVYSRITQLKWPVEKALTTPKMKK